MGKVSEKKSRIYTNKRNQFKFQYQTFFKWAEVEINLLKKFFVTFLSISSSNSHYSILSMQQQSAMQHNLLW